MRYFLCIWWLALIVSIGHAQNDPSSPSQQTQEQQKAAAEQSPFQQKNVSPNFYQIDCNHPDDHEAADLCEQRRMAKAAEDTVWWTRLQAWIGTAGFIGVLVTLYFTGQGTKAATRQVSLSRESLVLIDRAFVYPVENLQGPRLNGSGSIVGWNIGIKWKNSGNTPTVHLRLQINREVRTAPLPDDFAFLDAGISRDIPLFIAPGETIESALLPLDLAEIDDIISGDKLLFIWGWAEYDDVFEGTRRHRTEFCRQQFFVGSPRRKDGFSGRYHIYHQHNGADEECQTPLKTISAKDMGRR